MNAAKFAMPELNDGETYAGAIVNPDGTGHHIVIMPGDHDEANWADSMEWAKSICGDLPDRVEQALFFKHLPDQFRKDWYWSNSQHAADSDCAWYQLFGSGFQSISHESYELRARAVRRVAI